MGLIKYLSAEQEQILLEALKRDGSRGIYKELGLLYVEPTILASEVSVIDSATKKMAAAFRMAARMPWGHGGVHRCICGATSEAHDFTIPAGRIINSLCVHYVALHREAVSEDELDFIRQFDLEEVDPTNEELHFVR